MPQLHVRRSPVAPDVDLGSLAARCEGWTGADLAALCTEVRVDLDCLAYLGLDAGFGPACVCARARACVTVRKCVCMYVCMPVCLSVCVSVSSGIACTVCKSIHTVFLRSASPTLPWLWLPHDPPIPPPPLQAAMRTLRRDLDAAAISMQDFQAAWEDLHGMRTPPEPLAFFSKPVVLSL
jgi:hypothetical protein